MTLKILPHGRLQEWVADEQGYFAAEGLEYSFLPEGDYGVRRGERDAAGQVRTYTREVFTATQAWTDRLFPSLPQAAAYDQAVLA